MSKIAFDYPSPTCFVEPDLSSHLPALDGLRGLAILGVMVYHMTLLKGVCRLDRFLLTIHSLPAYGVDLFFVLSGFLITGILLDARSSPHYFRNFYARRTLRIFPLYYAVVFFCLVILPHFANAYSAKFGAIAGDEIWYWAYLSNYLVAIRQTWRHAILDPSWTLAIEEQFYLLWPAIVYFLSRKSLIRFCIALIAASLLFRIALVLTHTNPLSIIVLTPSKLDTLAAGGLLAAICRRDGALAWRPTARIIFYASLAAFLILCLFTRARWDAPIILTAGYTLLATTFSSLLLLSITISGPNILTLSPLRTLGRYSYALYLFHLPLRALLRDKLLPHQTLPTLFHSQLPAQIAFDLLAIFVTLAAAMLSWHLYEKHFLKLKRFFPAHHAATPTAPPNAVPDA